MKTSAVYVFRMISVMVLMPLVFIVVYPFVYVVLPESVARLADLPRDVSFFLLIECLLVPPFTLWLFFQGQRKVTEKSRREDSDTRDVI